jgi:uncharacterized protein
MAKREFVESRVEIEEILKEETTGYLGLSKDGQPYVVPLNYVYVDGKILSHCALTGKKLEYLQQNPLVCFTIGRYAEDEVIKRHQPECHMKWDSVICQGTARILKDVEERRSVLNAINQHFSPGAEEIDAESAAQCNVVEVTIAEMTGIQSRGKESKFWKHQFSK